MKFYKQMINKFLCRNYSSYYDTNDTPSACPNFPDKLFINSTIDKIVFKKYDDNSEKSVLIFPHFKPLRKLIEIELENKSINI